MKIYIVSIILLLSIGCATVQEKKTTSDRIESADLVASDPNVPEVTKTKIYRDVAVKNAEDAIRAGEQRNECEATLKSEKWKIDLVNWFIGVGVTALILLIAYGLWKFWPKPKISVGT